MKLDMGGKPGWRIECHAWLKNFDEYNERREELFDLLERIKGNGSVTIFFRSTPEYLELPGASYNHQSDQAVEELMEFFGKDNVDFVARVSRNPDRELGCIRGKTEKRD